MTKTPTFYCLHEVQMRPGAHVHTYNHGRRNGMHFDVQLRDVPVHTIVRQDGSVVEFAMHHELRAMLEAPLQDEIAKRMAGTIEAMENKRSRAEAISRQHVEERRAFRATPLWRRLLVAWRNEL